MHPRIRPSSTHRSSTHRSSTHRSSTRRSSTRRSSRRPPPPAPPPSAESDIDLLTKIAQLHEQGVLTDEEFAAKKAKILGI